MKIHFSYSARTDDRFTVDIPDGMRREQVRRLIDDYLGVEEYRPMDTFGRRHSVDWEHLTRIEVVL